jgi:predicted O-linked N-acetylglucosamine transferase (SPINDLY family)
MGLLSRFLKKTDPPAEEDALALVERAHALVRENKLDAALAVYRSACDASPSSVPAWFGAAQILQVQGRRDEAIECFRRAAEGSPPNAVVCFHYGNALAMAGRFDDAIEAYRKTVAIDPKLSAAHGNLGNALCDAGRPEEAIDAYRAAIALDDSSADLHFNLGKCMADIGRYEAAIESYERAISLQPAFADAHYNLGNALIHLNRPRSAIASFEKAVAHNPKFADACTNLGNAQAAVGLYEAAEANHRRALELKPESFKAHNNLGMTLYSVGKLADAVVSYRRAIELRADFDQAYTAMLFALSHDETVSPETLLNEHLQYGAVFAKPQPAGHGNDRDPGRPLRVGFVSADFRDHALAFFVEPLIARLGARTDMSLHAYYNHCVDDAVTRRLRDRFAQWTDIFGMRDDALVRRIRSDAIDILIDLSGHTGGNRLTALARKPAPIQASWMGYPGTTGLPAMDYYIGDRHFLPLPAMRAQFVERIVHLPASAPFLPAENAPDVGPLPALANGYLTFGSFNRLSKLRPGAIALWAGVLRSVPNARLLIGGLPEDRRRGSLDEWLESAGIDSDRVSFRSRCEMAAYFEMHNEVDVLLDTYPYTGGTTTVHGLWMGVPTLTLAGGSAPSRQGATILSHTGLEQFIANDPEDFAHKGAYWSSHVDELASLRRTLRERCRRSAPQNPDLIAAGLAHALRAMWKQWCAGLPPQDIDASDVRLDK